MSSNTAENSEKCSDGSLRSVERQTLTFEEDMWDQLGRISQYQKHGTSLLIGLQNFAIGYNKLIKKFSEGLRKCSSNFEKDMF